VVDADEEVVEGEVKKNSCQADSKWDARSIDGRKSRGDNFHARVGDESERVTSKGKGSKGGAFSAKATVLKDGGGDGIGQEEEADGGGKGEKQGLAYPDEEAVTQGNFFVESSVTSEMGKGDGGDGDAEEADGKLDQAEGVVEAGDGAIGEVGGKVAVNHDVDLDGGGSDGGGAEKSKYLFEARIVPDEKPAGLVAEGDGAWNHDEPLGESADENADGKTVDGALTESGIEDPGEEEADSDGDKVKGGGGEGGETEVVEAVEEAHIDGGEGEKEDEGKKDTGEFDSQSDFSGYGGEAWVEESDEGIGEDDPGSDDEKEGDKEESVDVAGEAEGGCFAFFGQFLRKGGDESGGESTFGKEITKEVWYAEGGDEGIELFASPEEGVEENFTDEPEDSGGSDGQHNAGGAFGAHLASNMERAFFGSTALMGERT